MLSGDDLPGSGKPIHPSGGAKPGSPPVAPGLAPMRTYSTVQCCSKFSQEGRILPLLQIASVCKMLTLHI